MNRHHLTLLAALSAAALLAGYGARRLTEPRLPSATAVNPAASTGKTAPATATPVFPPSHSTETLESLAAPDDTHLYARLALWLVDASEPDIAAFWSRYSKNDEPAQDVMDLVFLHWTRLDPQHAIAAWPSRAWRSWSRQDPQAALAAAIAAGPDQVESVAEAIGRFQPDWLRTHFDEIPEAARREALAVMARCEGGKDLLANLKLLKREGFPVGSELLKALAREDPEAAIEWAKRTPSDYDPFSENGDALPAVLQTLAAKSPDELARIAERTPSGKAKLQMEAALFANLVKTDPAAALEQARATTVPRTAAERYAAIGQGLVRTDPAQALQLAKDLFSACPDALNLSALIRYPGGNTNHETLEIPGVSEFMDALMVRQPQQVMEMANTLWPETGCDRRRPLVERRQPPARPQGQPPNPPRPSVDESPPSHPRRHRDGHRWLESRRKFPGKARRRAGTGLPSEAIRTTANPAGRMRATIDLANYLASADLAAWLDGGWFSLRGGIEATVFKQILLERWRREDPQGHLLWCRQNDSDAADEVFTTWAATEPQRVLDYYKSHPDDDAELFKLCQIALKNPELALRRLQEMIAAGISQSDLPAADGVISQLAKHSPAALEAALGSLPVAMKITAEVSLMREEMEASFASGLRKLIDRPDGLDLFPKIFQSSFSFGEKLIDELSNLPAAWRDRIVQKASIVLNTETAAKWAAVDLEAAGFTAQQAKAIRFKAVEALQYRDPEAALKLLAELDLPAKKREDVITYLFPYVSNAGKTEALLALLDSDAERQIARDALPKPSPPEPETPKIEQPAEWLAAVVALGPELSAEPYVSMTQSWEPEKLAALAASFRALPEHKKRHLAELYYKRGLGEDFPLQAEVIAFLVAHPIKEGDAVDPFSERAEGIDVSMATDYVVELAKENPEQAGDWIQDLPEGEAKWFAARNLRSVWSLYDPAAAEQWLKSLPAATREKVKASQ